MKLFCRLQVCATGSTIFRLCVWWYSSPRFTHLVGGVCVLSFLLLIYVCRGCGFAAAAAAAAGAWLCRVLSEEICIEVTINVIGSAVSFRDMPVCLAGYSAPRLNNFSSHPVPFVFCKHSGVEYACSVLDTAPGAQPGPAVSQRWLTAAVWYGQYSKSSPLAWSFTMKRLKSSTGVAYERQRGTPFREGGVASLSPSIVCIRSVVCALTINGIKGGGRGS